jgi:hypothetical protein
MMYCSFCFFLKCFPVSKWHSSFVNVFVVWFLIVKASQDVSVFDLRSVCLIFWTELFYYRVKTCISSRQNFERWSKVQIHASFLSLWFYLQTKSSSSLDYFTFKSTKVLPPDLLSKARYYLGWFLLRFVLF